MIRDESLSPTRFRSDWGEDDWTCLRREDAVRWNLPRRTADFLVDAGLPRTTVLLLKFRVDEGFEEIMAGSNRFLRFGRDEASDICLDVVDSFSVKSARRASEALRMNASVPQLAYSILEYRRYAQEVRKTDDEESQIKKAREFEAALVRLDSTVKEDPRSWWAQVVEQAIDGFL
jgi:hypothetical protein